MAEFPSFRNLPTEIRITIWELVKPPTRIIGQVPCRECWSHCFKWARGRNADCSPRRECEQKNHPDWRVRYIVHPKRDIIFPLLHASHESRAVWLPKFHQPSRHVVCETGVSSPDEGSVTCPVRFDVPFINYEADILTVFDDWGYTGALNTVDHRPQTEQSEVDPFVGLRRHEIRHAGFCESAEELWSGLLLLDLRTLPALESLTLIRMGPLPLDGSQDGELTDSSALEMYPAQSQGLDCVIPDVLYPYLGSPWDNFFHHWRPRGRLFEPRSEAPSHRVFSRFWTAFLWHLLYRDARKGFSRDSSSWWRFMEYVDSWVGELPCVLSQVDGCGEGGHSRRDMFGWMPKFGLRCKLLCEEGEVSGLKALGDANRGELVVWEEDTVRLEELRRLLPRRYVAE